MARDPFLTFRLDQLSQTAMAKASQIYKERLGLNIRELRVLRAIGDQPGLSSRSLSEATFIEQTLVSKHLRKLVDALESADARRVALHLTTQGQAIRETADRLGEEMEQDFLSVLTPEELVQFNHCLAKLRGWGAS
jgi:DNA-binding MarR family transcriptional regulator